MRLDMEHPPVSQLIASRPTIDLFGATVQRPWDPQRKYEGAVLKVYEHWCLEVSFLQHTPGSFVIFSRHSVERFSQLSAAALAELGKVTGEMEEALAHVLHLQPDRFNYLQMGNALHHLHVHGIPRYAGPRTYGAREWTDETYGHPPRWSSAEVSYDLVVALRSDIGQWLLRTGELGAFGDNTKLFRTVTPPET